MHSTPLEDATLQGLGNVIEKINEDASTRLQDSLKFLQKLPNEIHWLCNDLLTNVVIQSLDVFSVGGEAVKWLKTKLRDQFARCWICARAFHMAKAKLKQTRAHEFGFDEENPDPLVEDLNAWDMERLSFTLQRTASILEGSETVPISSLPPHFFSAIYECVFEPGLLESVRLFELFSTVFLGVQKNGRFLRMSEDTVPAMISFLFADTPGLRAWSEKSFARLSKMISPRDFNERLQRELYHSLKRLLPKLHSVEVRKRILSALAVFIKAVDKQVVLENLCTNEIDMARFVANEVFSIEDGSIATLRCLCEFLKKLGGDFWNRVTPVIPTNSAQAIMGSKKIQELFEHPDLIPVLDPGCLESDLVMWIEPFTSSLDGLVRQRVAAVVLPSLMEYFQHPRYAQESRRKYALIGLTVVKLLLNELAMKIASRSEVNEIIQHECREIVLRYCRPIIDMACPQCLSENEIEIRQQVMARDIIGLALQTDCERLRQEFVAVNERQEQPKCAPSNLYTDIWAPATDSIPFNDTDSAYQLIKNVRSAFLIDRFRRTNDSETADFDYAIEVVQNAIKTIMHRVGEFDSENVLKVLHQREACVTIALLLFSPDGGIYQANLDLIKQAFDSPGKSEAIKSMLSTFLEPTVDGLVTAMSSICNLKLFNPVPRLIKTCLLVVELLSSPTIGVMMNIQMDKTNKLGLQRLWRELWRMLRSVFLLAPNWSSRYEKELMIEFMRDVLELADTLFTAFRGFEQAINSEDNSTSSMSQVSPVKTTDIGKSLLQNCAHSLREISTWLRLSDDSLLRTCNRLVCAIIQRLARSDVELDEDTIEYLEGLAHHRKGYKNKMDQEMSAKIIMAISELSEDARDHLDAASVERRDAHKLSWKEAIEHSPTITKRPSRVNASTANSKIDFQKWNDKSRKPIDTVDLSADDFVDDAELANELGQLKPLLSSEFKAASSNRSASGTGSKPQPARSAAFGVIKADLAKETRDRRKLLNSSPMLRIGSQDKRKIVQSTSALPEKPAQTIMEDSSSSEGSDSDVEGLFSVPEAKTTKSPPKVRKVAKRSIQPLQPSVDAGNSAHYRRHKQRENAIRNAKARITPDLTPLHRKILEWNFDHAEDSPPNIDMVNLQNVANSFGSAADYYETFEPLLLCEAWEQVRQSKEQGSYTRFKVTIINRTAVDEFVDLYVSIPLDVASKNSISDPDLLVFFQEGQQESGAKKVPACFAKVQSITRRKDTVEVTLRCKPSPKVLENLRPKIELKALKLFSLTPVEREYAALVGLQYYDLRDEIIEAQPQSLQSTSVAAVQRTMQCYQVNEPQAKAILGAAENEGFNLIQGPPGTGKTKTILGIVGSYLSNYAHAIPIALPGQVISPPPPPKLLLCAPSNAAVDEIVVRLKDGVFNQKGEKHVPKIVRVGRTDAINASVRDVTLEELVDAEIVRQHQTTQDSSGPDVGLLREQLASLRGEMDAKRSALDQARKERRQTQGLEDQIKILTDRRNTLGSQIDEQRERNVRSARNLDIHRRQMQSKILAGADVICATLSGSGHEMLASMSVTFETVIIDEAAQSNELGALIPLKYGCRKCILVGDPNQLPPTILSQTAAKFDYQQSLFVRMQKNHPDSVHLLSIQYRMHPAISEQPSKVFYDSKLIDGEGMAEKTSRPWHSSRLLGPYRFFSVKGQEQHGSRGRSVFNRHEIDVAMQIYDRLVQDFVDVDFDGRIGIVTPYKQQLNKLKDAFRIQYGGTILNTVDFNTIDGFQGQEKDIIVLSCVRAQGSSTVGFLRDVRRMNVALTRARCSLFILGNEEALSTNRIWRELIDNAKARGFFTAVHKKTFASSTRIENLETVDRRNGYDRKRKVEHDEQVPAKTTKLESPLANAFQEPKPVKLEPGKESRKVKPERPQSIPHNLDLKHAAQSLAAPSYSGSKPKNTELKPMSALNGSLHSAIKSEPRSKSDLTPKEEPNSAEGDQTTSALPPPRPIKRKPVDVFIRSKKPSKR